MDLLIVRIRAVLEKTAPLFNLHMTMTCTQSFLTTIIDLVVQLVQREGGEVERFGRYFHKQLWWFTYETLLKFIGKPVKDCAENILTELAELLFNELAYYQLMQEYYRLVSFMSF